MTSLAVLDFSGTAIKLDINKHIKVNIYLLPFEVVGSSPMVSTVEPANGT